VAFDWQFNAGTIASHATLQSFPSKGHIPAGGKQIIALKARPGIPERVQAVAHFEVAHFEPVPVTLTVEGVYASVATSLPRILPDNWMQVVLRAAQTIMHRGDCLLDAVLKLAHEAPKDIKSATESANLTGATSPLVC
jgi:hydrocephalus-inducing protein